jgi:hypothetical protein
MIEISNVVVEANFIAYGYYGFYCDPGSGFYSDHYHRFAEVF